VLGDSGAQWDTPEEFRAFIAAQMAKWVGIIRAAHIEMR